MKILVLVDSIGRSAAGIVFERIIKALYDKTVDLQVLCRENNSNSFNIPRMYILPAKFPKDTNISKVKFILTGFDYHRSKWIRLALKEIKCINKNFNKVLVLAGGPCYHILNLAYKISRIYRVHYHIHAVDAIPSPECWGENKFLRNAKKKYIFKSFHYASSLSMISPQMLHYQKELMEINNIKSGVIYNPVNNEMVTKSKKSGSEKYLLYAGSVTKVRHPGYLIQAMAEIKNEFPDVYLYFLGSDKQLVLNYCPDNILPQNIKVLEWTDRSVEYLKNAIALVDIDLNRPGDVFISGKLISYLNSDLPILSISPLKSPSRELLKYLNEGVFFAVHNTQDISEKIRQILIFKNNIDVREERTRFVKNFSLQNITDNLLEMITY